MPHASNPLEIYYPNGFTQANQMYIWDGSKPVLWDGSVTFSGSLPSTVAGNKTNNAAAPTNDNFGALTAIANASAPTWTEGRQVLLSADLSGSLRVAATPLAQKTLKTLSGSFTSDTDIIAAVTSKRIKVVAYSFRTFGTSATLVLLKSNGTGGTLLWTEALQSITGTVQGSNLAVPAPSFLFATATGEKLTADTNTGDTVYWSLTYFDDDAT